MAKYISITLLMIVLLANSSCKKEENEVFINCNQCVIADWVGEYEGTGDYYDGDEETIKDIGTVVTLTNTYGNYIKVNVVAEGLYSETITVLLDEMGYSIHQVNENNQLDLTIAKSNKRYRLTGTFKTYIDFPKYFESFSFEVYRNLE